MTTLEERARAIRLVCTDIDGVLTTGALQYGDTDSHGKHFHVRDGAAIKWLQRFGIPVAFTPLGIIVALTFIGLPFVVRTLQPAIEDLDPGVEEAAGILGASQMQTFLRVIAPALLPSLLTGFALAFSRALGEYGSVIFISGNMPLRTEITPLLIVTKLEQFDYAGATALGAVQLTASFVMLFGINIVQWWTGRKTGTR